MLVGGYAPVAGDDLPAVNGSGRHQSMARQQLTTNLC